MIRLYDQKFSLIPPYYAEHCEPMESTEKFYKLLDFHISFNLFF